MACKGQGFKSPQLHQAQRIFFLRSEHRLPEIRQKTRLLNLFPTGDLTPLEQLVAIPLAAAVKGIPFLVLVVLLVGLARRQERRWLEAAAVASWAGRP
jgi:hypothetical protein